MKKLLILSALLLNIVTQAQPAIHVTGAATCGTDTFEQECVLRDHEKTTLMYLNLDEGALVVKVRMAPSLEHVIISVTTFDRKEDHGLEVIGWQRAIQPLGKMAHFGRSGGKLDYELSVLATKE